MIEVDGKQGAGALPLRPIRHGDEWSETYLGRVARAMGIRRPWRADLDKLRVFMPGLETVAEEGRPMYCGKRLPRWATLGQRAQIRYCYACLSEHRYVRARWRLAAYTVCPTHGVTLREGLVEPAITTAYKRAAKRLVDQITEDEAQQGASCPTPAALAHVRRIWGAFEDAVRRGATDQEVGETLAWAILSERLLDLAATAKRGPDYPTAEDPRHEHRARWLSDKGLTLAPDEVAIQQFLSQLPSSPRRAVLAGLKRLIADETREPTLLSELPLARMWHALLEAKPVEAAPLSGALPQALRPAGHKSLDAVETLAGCSWRFLQHLLVDGWFTQVRRVTFGRKRYTFLSDADVARLQDFLGSTFPLEDLLSSQGLTRKEAFLFLQCRSIGSVSVGPWRRYLKADVEDLVRQFAAAARPLPCAGPSVHALWDPWIFQRGRYSTCAVEVLKESSLNKPVNPHDS